MMRIRPTTDIDIPWIKQVFLSIGTDWKEGIAGFLAEEDGRKIGLITYMVDAGVCNIISLNALTPGRGVGSALLDRLEVFAKQEGLSKITVASNTVTDTFFLKKGFAPQEDMLILSLA